MATRGAAGVAAIFAVLAAPWAEAFTFETVVSTGCHERISLSALSAQGWPGGARAGSASHEDEVLGKNLPFSVAPGTDRWTLSLLVGVRDNDTHGYSLTDLPELAGVHNGADNQDAHCLRSPSQDFDQGDLSALEACRKFIHRELDAALGEDGAPDLQAQEPVAVALRFQRRPVALSRYAFHLGRALHALQDSYAHSLRTDGEVVSVLNYVDGALLGKVDELRDGHAHLSSLDGCEGRSPAELERVERAQAASRALLEAVGRFASSRAERHAHVDAALDEALRYHPGCTAKNSWCGSLQQLLPQDPDQPASEGCSASPGGSGALSLGALGLLVALARRRGPRASP